MRKTKEGDINGSFVTVQQYAYSHNIGYSKAREIADKAGAIRRFGRLVRIDVRAADAYINEKCREERK